MPAFLETKALLRGGGPGEAGLESCCPGEGVGPLWVGPLLAGRWDQVCQGLPLGQGGAGQGQQEGQMGAQNGWPRKAL